MDRGGEFRGSLADWSRKYAQASSVTRDDLKIGKAGVYLIANYGKTGTFRLIPWQQIMERIALKAMPASAGS